MLPEVRSAERRRVLQANAFITYKLGPLNEEERKDNQGSDEK